MMQKSFLRLFVIFLGFSYVLSVSAIPATRIKSLNGEDSSVIIPSLAQGAVLKLENGEEMGEIGLMERRMELEIQDYGGTGANKDHDPKTPGNG